MKKLTSKWNCIYVLRAFRTITGRLCRTINKTVFRFFFIIPSFNDGFYSSVFVFDRATSFSNLAFNENSTGNNMEWAKKNKA